MQATRNFFPSHLRLLTATAVLALAAGFAQTANARPHGGGHEGMGGPGMSLMNPRAVDRVLDSVNATTEQRSQIKQIVAAAHTDMKAQRGEGRKLAEQGQALFAQPTVDARAAETLRQQMLARHDQASKRAMQAMLDISRVLSPEQRKQLSDRLTQRRSMMERHRAERDSMAPAQR